MVGLRSRKAFLLEHFAFPQSYRFTGSWPRSFLLKSDFVGSFKIVLELWNMDDWILRHFFFLKSKSAFVEWLKFNLRQFNSFLLNLTAFIPLRFKTDRQENKKF